MRSLLLSALLLVVAACHGKPGDDCSDTPGSCLDKASHLVCVNKKYVLETCKGAGGCNDEGKVLTCDNSKAAIGDGCGQEGARACSADGAAELRCRGGKMSVEWSCKGGCTLDASNNPKCVPTGEVGDTCRSDFFVCDGKQKTQLACVDGKLAVSRTCNGATGCTTASAAGGVKCDRTKAVEGEKCTEEGKGACDLTQKNVLECQGGKFHTTMHCLGPLGCELPGNYSVRCDKSVVPLGEACDEEAVTCSTDGVQVRCTDGKWTADKKWKPKKGETCAQTTARYTVSKETEKFEPR